MNASSSPSRKIPVEKIIIVSLTLLAFAVRFWHLVDFPPGWRDDELINSLVISQKVLDGDWQLFYPDASGNEILYFALNAPMLALFGPTAVGMRLLSVFWGVTAVPLIWLLGRKLFDRWVGLLAAAGVAVSFWSLMYSRFALRQIVTPTLLLLAFYFFWRALTGVRYQVSGVKGKNHVSRITNHALPITVHEVVTQRHYRLPFTDYGLAGFWLALGFYVYFAGRGVPMILLAFCGYLAVVAWPLFRQRWRGIVFMFVITAVLVLPLFLSINQQPEAEARVGELAGPLVAARSGDFSLIQKHIVTTLSMFHTDGDDEWIYNIPHRPVFGPLGAVFMWAGVLIALYWTFKPLPEWARQARTRFHARHSPLPPVPPLQDYHLPAAFLLIWWLVGISPGFVSVPPASLGHTIIALPATYLLMALPVWWLKRAMVNGKWLTVNAKVAGLVSGGLGVILIASIAVRDLPAYFETWPQQAMVRFLYRTDLHELAAYLNEGAAMTDVAIPSLLAGPWDQLALASDLQADTAVTPRWYHPERAIFLRPSLNLVGVPDVPFAYADRLEPAGEPLPTSHFVPMQPTFSLPENSQPVCFANGLCNVFANYDQTEGILELGWQVARPLDLPPFTLISNPPPPGVYAGPRLQAFAQLLGADGNFITGDDGFWADPYSLQPGDVFLQQHHLTVPPDTNPSVVAFGLYDPLTGTRILTADGRDHVTLEIGD